MRSFSLPLSLVALMACGCNQDAKIGLVAKSIHEGSTEESVVQFAVAQGWHNERFPKTDEYGKFSSQDYAYFFRIYDKSRPKDFELLIAFDSTGKVINGGITIYYLPLIGEKTRVTLGSR